MGSLFCSVTEGDWCYAFKAFGQVTSTPDHKDGTDDAAGIAKRCLRDVKTALQFWRS